MDAMPMIQVSGLATNYEQVGSGPVLLLLHGWANSWEAWLPIVPVLSDHYTLLMPDLPGCGKTQTPKEGWSTAQHARWLQQFIETMNTVPQTIIGHSFGGKILLEYTSGNYSPQPKKIILIDASGIPNILTPKQKLLQGIARLTPSIIKQQIGAKLRGKVYQSFGADSDYLYANAFQKETLQIILEEDYTERLARIGQPTLILWGIQDLSAPHWQGESMHTLIPLNQFVSYEAGHFPHQEHPQEVAKEILQFLK
jgi:pimeloyl-ACP methyl ester carboxylesterase